MSSSKILVTGGAGFIGSHLVLELLSRGYDVTVLDNLSPLVHGKPDNSPSYLSIKNKVRFIKGDIRNRKAWHSVLKNQNIIVHLAAETGTGHSMYNIERYVDVNVRGTSLLLDILANGKNKVRKIIVASSRAIYGEGKYRCQEDGIVYPLQRKESDMAKRVFEVKCPICDGEVELLPTDEESQLHPTSFYGVTKRSQEEMVMMVGKVLSIPVVALRYQNVYGPGQSLLNPYTGILSVFTTRIKNGHHIDIYEDGKESRDFVYVDDVVDATIRGIENDAANDKTFNVGSGVATSVLEVAMTLKKIFKSSVNVKISGSFRIGDIRHNVADLTRIRSLLAYEPRYNFTNGIKHFADWVHKQRIALDSYDRSIGELKTLGLLK